jgi:hypothetical protein
LGRARWPYDTHYECYVGADDVRSIQRG